MKPIIFIVLIMSILVSGLIIYGCTGSAPSATTSEPAPSPTISEPVMDITGTWRGPCNSRLASLVGVTAVFQQTGMSFNGTFSFSYEATGNISGTINGNTINFTITLLSPPNCVWSFNGTGTIKLSQESQPIIFFNYGGISTCGGKENGGGNLTKRD